MERVTSRNSDGAVSQLSDLNRSDALERLADYEDTGLTPEEVVKKTEILAAYQKYGMEPCDYMTRQGAFIAERNKQKKTIASSDVGGVETYADREL